MRECLSYFVIYVSLVILVGVFPVVLSNLPQYPSVVTRARRCYQLAVYQGVRVLSLTTVPGVRFAGPAILRAHFVPDIIRFTSYSMWKLAAPPVLTLKCCAFCPQNTFV